MAVVQLCRLVHKLSRAHRCTYFGLMAMKGAGGPNVATSIEKHTKGSDQTQTQKGEGKGGSRSVWKD